MLIFLSILGLSSGLMIAGGIFTTLLVIGLIPHFAERTNSQKHILLYEDMIVLGSLCGNILSLYTLSISIQWQFVTTVIFIVSGLFSGIFVGCLAISIAEMLNTMPIFSSRIHLKRCPFVMVAMAFGKLAGSLYYFFSL